MSVKWHPEHFTCQNCNQPLYGGSFIKRENNPYCKICFLKLKQIENESKGIVCSKCKLIIENPRKSILLNGERFHGYHFHCTVCGKELESDFKIHDKRLYCLSDYKRIASTVCEVCKDNIVGRVFSALGRNYHPEHFVCFKCHNPVSESSFNEYNGKIYCSNHFSEVSGSACGRCFQIHKGTPVSALGRKWCKNHFACFGCETNMSDLALKNGKFYEWDLKPFCKNCYEKLPTEIKRRIFKYLEIEKKAAGN